MDLISESISGESDMINKDRQLIPVLIYLSPIRDAEDNLAGFLETVEDLRPIKEVNSRETHAYVFRHLIGKSPEMTRIFQTLPLLAQSDSAILITGETGTGKDLLAEAVHQLPIEQKAPLSRSIVARCLKPCWSPSFSVTEKGHLRVRWKTSPEDFVWPTTERFTLRRSEIFP